MFYYSGIFVQLLIDGHLCMFQTLVKMNDYFDVNVLASYNNVLKINGGQIDRSILYIRKLKVSILFIFCDMMASSLSTSCITEVTIFVS